MIIYSCWRSIKTPTVSPQQAEQLKQLKHFLAPKTPFLYPKAAILHLKTVCFISKNASKQAVFTSFLLFFYQFLMKNKVFYLFFMVFATSLCCFCSEMKHLFLSFPRRRPTANTHSRSLTLQRYAGCPSLQLWRKEGNCFYIFFVLSTTIVKKVKINCSPPLYCAAIERSTSVAASGESKRQCSPICLLKGFFQYRSITSFLSC